MDYPAKNDPDQAEIAKVNIFVRNGHHNGRIDILAVNVLFQL